jgi:glycine cleavage system T protein
MKELILKNIHQELKAKMVPFAGWNMPVLYTGINEEHNAVRNSVGIFDVSHMGQLTVKGGATEEFLNFVSTNNVKKIQNGRAQYGLVLNREGGVIDDIINYKIDKDNYFVCANASNVEEVYVWFLNQSKDEKFKDLEIKNLSTLYVQIALQGPDAISILSEFFGEKISLLKRFNFLKEEKFSTEDADCLIARTGYTGEDGCEIFVPKEFGEEIWKGLISSGSAINKPVKPCGLGARDTLRLEACMPLHGHEIRPDITPLSAKLDKFLDFEKDFIGSKSLLQQKQLGVSPVLVGLQVEGSGIIRENYPVVLNDRTIGWVTSGTMTPTIGRAIGLALVMPDNAQIGSNLGVKVRDKTLNVTVVETPFYKRA